MRPWRASLPRSKQSGSMRLGSAPAQTRGRRCSSISRWFIIGSGCTQPWATALRLRRGPAWRRSPCALRRDILIYPLHTKGGGPPGSGAPIGQPQGCEMSEALPCEIKALGAAGRLVPPHAAAALGVAAAQVVGAHLCEVAAVALTLPHPAR